MPVGDADDSAGERLDLQRSSGEPVVEHRRPPSRGARRTPRASGVARGPLAHPGLGGDVHLLVRQRQIRFADRLLSSFRQAAVVKSPSVRTWRALSLKGSRTRRPRADRRGRSCRRHDARGAQEVRSTAVSARPGISPAPRTCGPTRACNARRRSGSRRQRCRGPRAP